MCFTPGGDCAGLIARAVGEARREVLVQAYAFTSAPVAEALARAAARGVRVRVVLDDSQLGERYTVAAYLDRRGVEVWVDDPPGIAHNKVMVLDRAAVLTGSFNFSRAAQERNTENLVLLRDPALAAAYAENWERRRAESAPLDEARRALAARASSGEGDAAETPKRPPRVGLF